MAPNDMLLSSWNILYTVILQVIWGAGARLGKNTQVTVQIVGCLLVIFLHVFLLMFENNVTVL